MHYGNTSCVFGLVKWICIQLWFHFRHFKLFTEEMSEKELLEKKNLKKDLYGMLGMGVKT